MSDPESAGICRRRSLGKTQSRKTQSRKTQSRKGSKDPFFYASQRCEFNLYQVFPLVGSQEQAFACRLFCGKEFS